jgi:Fe-S-cluster containining protein
LKLTHPCKCHRCDNSCNFGSGAFINDEIKKLAKHLNISVDELKKNHLEEIKKFNTTLYRPKLHRENNKPYGKCTFYKKDQGCTVHDAKPMECTVAMGCKDYGEDLITWFDLNYFFNPDDPESIRELKLYIESGGKLIDGIKIEDFVDKKTLKQLDKYEHLEKDRHRDWDKILGLDDANNKKENEKK